MTLFRNDDGKVIRFADGDNAGKVMRDDECCCDEQTGCSVILTTNYDPDNPVFILPITYHFIADVTNCDSVTWSATNLYTGNTTGATISNEMFQGGGRYECDVTFTLAASWSVRATCSEECWGQKDVTTDQSCHCDGWKSQVAVSLNGFTREYFGSGIARNTWILIPNYYNSPSCQDETQCVWASPSKCWQPQYFTYQPLPHWVCINFKKYDFLNVTYIVTRIPGIVYPSICRYESSPITVCGSQFRLQLDIKQSGYNPSPSAKAVALRVIRDGQTVFAWAGEYIKNSTGCFDDVFDISSIAMDVSFSGTGNTTTLCTVPQEIELQSFPDGSGHLNCYYRVTDIAGTVTCPTASLAWAS